jgi:hypothetical protein
MENLKTFDDAADGFIDGSRIPSPELSGEIFNPDQMAAGP